MRTWQILRRPNIRTGKNIIFKDGAKVFICDTALFEIGDHCFFHPHTRFLLTKPNPVLKIGKWVYVGMYSVIACKNSIEIGDFTVIAPFCYFVDHDHGFASSDVVLNQKSVMKSIKIGRDCYFGVHSIVLGGVTIGDGAVIGAGSVVTCDILSYEVWAGNPAKFIKKRS